MPAAALDACAQHSSDLHIYRYWPTVDDIARAFACLCALLLPSRGEHRAAPAPEPAPALTVRSRRSLPIHKSPYACEAAEKRPFVDTVSPVRPYVLAEPRKRPGDAKRHGCPSRCGGVAGMRTRAAKTLRLKAQRQREFFWPTVGLDYPQVRRHGAPSS